MKLQELKELILKDGTIVSSRIIQIKEVIFQDEKIDKEEAEFIFDINSTNLPTEDESSWQSLFVDAVSRFLLADKNSPKVINAEEAKWLISKIGEDDQIDRNEKALLLYLRDMVQSMPTSLSEFINKNA